MFGVEFLYVGGGRGVGRFFFYNCLVWFLVFLFIVFNLRYRGNFSSVWNGGKEIGIRLVK